MMTESQLRALFKEELKNFSLNFKDTLSIEEASDFSSFSVEKLYQLRKTRKVLTFNPDGGRIFFDKESLRRYMRTEERQVQDVIDFNAANHKKRTA